MQEVGLRGERRPSSTGIAVHQQDVQWRCDRECQVAAIVEQQVLAGRDLDMATP